MSGKTDEDKAGPDLKLPTVPGESGLRARPSTGLPVRTPHRSGLLG